ncbi:unnamed protein product, partial [Symbiodinium sp. KB8]
ATNLENTVLPGAQFFVNDQGDIVFSEASTDLAGQQVPMQIGVPSNHYREKERGAALEVVLVRMKQPPEIAMCREMKKLA